MYHTPVILLTAIVTTISAIDFTFGSNSIDSTSRVPFKFKLESDLSNNRNGDEKKNVKFEGNSAKGFKFEDDVQNNQENTLKNLDEIDKNRTSGKVIFQNDNEISNQEYQMKPQGHQTKRKGRRKPRQQFSGYGLAPQRVPGYPGFGPELYRPPSPRPSTFDTALSSIFNAFSSIARYDDYQCVPRLLCEVASGKTSLGGVGDQLSGLQPLVTLIAAYSGLHNSPAFFFGRAIFIGMTSKGKPNICYEAYPLCPSDPEQLVHYLNNYNGGFFRFFSNPQQYAEQNIQQFIGHLSNIPQRYGLYQGQPGQNLGLPPNNQNIGFPQTQSPGFSQNPNFDYQQNLQNTIGGYGLQNQLSNYNNLQKQYLHQKKYGYGAKQYSLPKSTKLNENNKIQRRILTNANAFEDFDKPKENTWTFPENKRNGRKINFPAEENKLLQGNNANGFNFPEKQSNRQYIDYYNYPPLVDVQSKLPNYEVVEKVNEDNINQNTKQEDKIEIVYVLRGNGDPYNPEVVRLRPGQKIE